MLGTPCGEYPAICTKAVIKQLRHIPGRRVASIFVRRLCVLVIGDTFSFFFSALIECKATRCSKK